MSQDKDSGLVMVLAATNMPWDLDDVRPLLMHVMTITRILITLMKG